MTWNLKLPSLHKTYANHFKMGNIISVRDFDDTGLVESIKHHYNAITAENEMKPVHIALSPNEFNFERADKIVSWANQNDIAVVGHTLAWHGQSSPWLSQNTNGSPLTRAEAKRNLESFIKAYVSRYSGRIHSWDVANEVFRDEKDDYTGTWRDLLRRETDNPRAVGHWFLAYANGADAELGECGSDYIFDAFYFARRNDPHAILYYNDYNEEYPTKRRCMVEMAEDINAEWEKHPHYDGRKLIEGLGMQAHYNHETDFENVRKSLEHFAKTGLKLSVTELDITFGSKDAPAKPLTDEQLKKQAELFENLYNMYKEFSAHIERVTIWGKNDQQSWREWGAPTLFDDNCQAKEAFHKVIGAC